MQNKKQKLSIYIHSEYSDTVFDVIPAETVAHADGVQIFETEVESGRNSTVSVKLLEKPTHQSNIQIKRVVLNGIELGNIDQYSTYRSYITRRLIPRTYGYMNEIGEYRIRVHQNAIIHNYLSYFRARCCG